MRTSFHHQPEAQHPNFQLSTSWQADYPIFGSLLGLKSDISRGPGCAKRRHRRAMLWRLHTVPRDDLSRQIAATDEGGGCLITADCMLQSQFQQSQGNKS
jgi:hypothetical protein